MLNGRGSRRSGGKRVSRWSEGRKAWQGLEPLEQRLLLAGDFTVTASAFSPTNNQSPELFGTADNAGAIVTVTVNGHSYTAVRDTVHSWELAAGVIDPLPEGTYDIAVSAVNAAEGKSATDNTANELVIDLTPPVVTISPLTTADTTPALSGTVNDPTAAIYVRLIPNSAPFTATNNGNGTWTLADNTITPALTQRVYDFYVQAADRAGNPGYDATTNEVHITSIALAVGVNARTTNDRTPQLTGTVNDRTATVNVSVNGQSFAATNNGDGTWTLADNTIATLADGTYSVAATATAGADTATEATNNELVIESVPPVVAFSAASFNSTSATPVITGTIDDPTATVTVMVQFDLQKYVATKNGATWTITLPSQLDWTYDIYVEATDPAGNVDSQTLLDGLTVDAVGPTVTFDAIRTTTSSPEVTGTISDPNATVKVTVRGKQYDAVNNQDAAHGKAGTWTLAAGTIDELPATAGSYTMTALATDAGSKTGTATGTLTAGITVAVTSDMTVSSRRPGISGTISDPGAVVKVTVDGRTYTATDNGDGTWTLAENTIPPSAPLADGAYDVTVKATLNDFQDTETVSLTVDGTAPTVSVYSRHTSDTTPGISGKAADANLSDITVTINGQTFKKSDSTLQYNTSTNEWSVLDGRVNELTVGAHVVTVTATDTFGNSATGTDNMYIDFPLGVDLLVTNDTTPDLTGTVGNAQATITVTIEGNDYAGINNGDGTWRLDGDAVFVDAEGQPAPLDVGVYGVTVTGAAGNLAGTATLAAGLTIDTTTPVVTVDSLTTNSASPALTGTVDDADAAIVVTVNGQTFDAASGVSVGADGSWALTDGRITALAVGTYDIAVTATDAAGNAATDTTTGELIVTPVPQVTRKVTSDTTPSVSGTVWDAANVTALTVTVNGQTFSLTNGVTIVEATGVWTLADNKLTVMAEGTYDVTVTATNAGNQSTDTTAGELAIDLTDPTVTVDSLTTTYTSPHLTGTVSEPQNIAELTVQAGTGTVFKLSTADSPLTLDRTTGVWTLAKGAISTALSVGQTYDVTATATDGAGNVGTDVTSGELRVVNQTVITLGLATWTHKLVFTDADGTKVTVSTMMRQTMPPNMTIYFDSNSPVEVVKHSMVYEIKALSGVTLYGIQLLRDTPNINISTSGGTIAGTTISGIAGNYELVKLNAKTTDLIGNVNMPSGLIRNVTLRSISGSEILMGAVKTGGVTFNVARQVEDTNIRVTDMSVSSFKAGQMINSSLFVGVQGQTDANSDNVADLPIPANLHAGLSIGRFSIAGIKGVTGDSFVNSNIAADRISAVALKDARLDNDGEAFGVTANTLKTLTLRQGQTKLKYPAAWDGVLDLLDLTVRLPLA